MPPSRPQDWLPTSREVLADQRAAYDAMRHRCPVAYSDVQGWTLFRHRHVLDVLHDPDTFSNHVSRHLSVPNGMDPPEHTPFRRLIEPYFDAAAIQHFEPACRAIAAELVDGIRNRNEIECMDAFARPFAARAQCAFLGWPEELAPSLAEWVLANQQATLEQDRPTLKRLAEAFRSRVTNALEHRRAGSNEGEDTTSRLMQETVEGRRLTDDEIASIMRNWTVGEIGTLSAAIGILVHALATRPELQVQLRSNPARIPDAVEEILRWHGPLVDNRRVATKAIKVNGRRIEAGERVTVNWIAANRDPEAFDSPDSLQLDRDPSRSLLWGSGVHVCPGAPLARMELRVVLEEILTGGFRLESSHGEMPEPARYPASGFQQLPVCLRHLHDESTT